MGEIDPISCRRGNKGDGPVPASHARMGTEIRNHLLCEETYSREKKALYTSPELLNRRGGLEDDPK